MRKLWIAINSLAMTIPLVGAPAGEVGSTKTATAHLVAVRAIGGALQVEPRVAGAGTSVYIACTDGTYIHREYEGVAPAVVELVRSDGSFVADGQCKYRVYIHPAVDEEAMRAAEEADDDQLLEQLTRLERQATAISDGAFVVIGSQARVPERGERENEEQRESSHDTN